MANAKRRVPRTLAKVPTGIKGLDEITYGGLPRGRPTLICGSAGCGKTLFGIEFLVRGATEFDEPGVMIAFEETADELAQNVASLGFDLDALVAKKKLAIDYIRVERSEIEETGEYDLEGLFIRLGLAIDNIGAKRVVLDTVEALFAALPNEAIVRAELRRLFAWLKDKGVSAIITAERGSSQLTRHGLEEYVADCVILLDHRVSEQISTRRLRVVKYRGSLHGTNEYPFLIDEQGITVIPITSIGLSHTASNDRVSTGVPRLDAMLGGKAFYRGSSVLISGMAGTGKSSLSASFANATCARGERVLYFAFEESRDQIIRNMNSIGIDLQQWEKKGLLKFENSRPSAYGLETHLALIHKAVDAYQPSAVVLDPITNLLTTGASLEVRSMLTRLIDFLKSRDITSIYTSLTNGGAALEESEVGVSSLMDTWILLREYESNGERNRGLYILKSRGMPHSNQVREFRLTDHGIDLVDVYVGSQGVLMGTSRASQEAQEEVATLARQQDVKRTRRELERKRQLMEAQITELRAKFESETEELNEALANDQARDNAALAERKRISSLRQADQEPNGRENGSSKGGAQ